MINSFAPMHMLSVQELQQQNGGAVSPRGFYVQDDYNGGFVCVFTGSPYPVDPVESPGFRVVETGVQ
jgi:hypothetical protein